MRPQRVHNFGTYFITTQSWGRHSLFQVDEVAKLFISTLYRYCVEGNYLLHEFVVMSDHVHLIVTPTRVTLERVMQLIKGGFSHDLPDSRHKQPVWQVGVTDHRIRAFEDCLRHREYLRTNPVRRGLGVAAEQYEFSSTHPRYKTESIPQRLKPAALAADRQG